MFAFGGFHSDFSTPAFAQGSSSGGQGSDNGSGQGKNYVTFSEATILRYSPKQLKELRGFFLGVSTTDGFILEGHDKDLSLMILTNLNLAVRFTKNLIREMRDAKNAKEKLKILEKYLKSARKLEQELVAESEEFAIGFGDLFGGELSKKLREDESLAERFAEWTVTDRMVTIQQIKIRMLLAWKKRVLKN